MICGASQPPNGHKTAGFLWVAPIVGWARGSNILYGWGYGGYDGWGGVGGARGVGGDLSALEEKYCHLAKVEVDEMSEKLERSKREDFERGRKVWRSKS